MRRQPGRGTAPERRRSARADKGRRRRRHALLAQCRGSCRRRAASRPPAADPVARPAFVRRPASDDCGPRLRPASPARRTRSGRGPPRGAPPARRSTGPHVRYASPAPSSAPPTTARSRPTRPRVPADQRAGAADRGALATRRCRAKTAEFRERLAKGETLDDLLPEAFATVREAARRTLGLRHFDVQLVGGMVLHQGNIAEMKTGEGKTLVATLPVYLNALAGKGVHVVTVNDYLAQRDADWMGRIYHFLGLTVGVIVHGLTDERAPRRLRRRHHLRHQQRVRLRLPARQHEVPAGGDGPARLQLRDRRRGRLHPDRRGAHAADHLRPGRGQLRALPPGRRA